MKIFSRKRGGERRAFFLLFTLTATIGLNASSPTPKEIQEDIHTCKEGGFFSSRACRVSGSWLSHNGYLARGKVYLERSCNTGGYVSCRMLGNLYYKEYAQYNEYMGNNQKKKKILKKSLDYYQEACVRYDYKSCLIVKQMASKEEREM